MQKIDNYNFIKIFTVNLDQLHVFFNTFEQGGDSLVGGVRAQTSATAGSVTAAR